MGESKHRSKYSLPVYRTFQNVSMVRPGFKIIGILIRKNKLSQINV